MRFNRTATVEQGIAACPRVTSAGTDARGHRLTILAGTTRLALNHLGQAGTFVACIDTRTPNPAPATFAAIMILRGPHTTDGGAATSAARPQVTRLSSPTSAAAVPARAPSKFASGSVDIQDAKPP